MIPLTEAGADSATISVAAQRNGGYRIFPNDSGAWLEVYDEKYRRWRKVKNPIRIRRPHRFIRVAIPILGNPLRVEGRL